MYRMRCKMICHSVTEPQGSNDPKMCGVSFGAVWSPDSGKPEDENAVFGKFTPSGHVNLTIVEEVAKNLNWAKPTTWTSPKHRSNELL